MIDRLIDTKYVGSRDIRINIFRSPVPDTSLLTLCLVTEMYGWGAEWMDTWLRGCMKRISSMNGWLVRFKEK